MILSESIPSSPNLLYPQVCTRPSPVSRAEKASPQVSLMTGMKKSIWKGRELKSSMNL